MRRMHRYRGRRLRTGSKVVTLVMMTLLLAGILFVGDQFAEKISVLFAPPQEASDGEDLPAQLPRDESTADDDATPRPGQVEPEPDAVDYAEHTGGVVRFAIREAVIIARRPIARSSSAARLKAPTNQ